MILKCSSAFLIAISTILATQGPQIHAAPISSILSPYSQSSSYSSPPLSSSPPSILKRWETKGTPLRQKRAQRAQRRGVYPSDSQTIPPSSDETTWHSLQSVEEQLKQKSMVPTISEMMWIDRTLEGHAVVDETDDDDGNELLDTESERAWNFDAEEEEGQGTIEGEIFMEEDYDDDKDEGGEDMDLDESMKPDVEVWKAVVNKLSLATGLIRKEAIANSRSTQIEITFAERDINIYWGTGKLLLEKPHLGYFIPITIIANIHAFFDNMKAPLELAGKYTKYYTELIKAILTSISIPTERLKFVQGSSYQPTAEYALAYMRMCSKTTEREAQVEQSHL
ncbi:hypothetical protein BGZ46_003944 [Entomortierella lignicola]|nr:hypothetical protein BGZ46_003944 [Entomortierella lignicola]